MAVILTENFPVAEALNSRRGIAYKPLRIGIVNLMPLKERTESDFLRIFDRYPLDIEVDFISMATHRSKSSSQERIDRYYVTTDVAMQRRYDGVIVTGAPVELHDFTDVDYWDELTQFMDWCDENVKSTIYICWGAFAALFHCYGIGKRVLPVKLSGVYQHEVVAKDEAIVDGFDNSFYAPHSRNTEIDMDALNRCAQLSVVVNSPVAGPHLIESDNGRRFFVMGHWEYAPDTLDMEYRRDSGKGLNPAIPVNYYVNDDPSSGYQANWRAHGVMFYFNWLTKYCGRHE